MEFKKYQHIVRLNDTNAEGIDVGECYIFPKIDGTNSQVWLDDDGNLCAGSRNRKLTIENDNAGFFEAILKDDRVKRYLDDHPGHRLYGEWLVPHSLKTYRDDAWRKFYVFDVCVDAETLDGVEYIPYEEYAPVLMEYGLDFIDPIKVIVNPSQDDLIHCLDINDFLIQDGKGVGEGIVIKNYSYKNKFGRVNWAKVVTSEFKEKHRKEMGAPRLERHIVEQDIVSKYITKAFVEKEFYKLKEDERGWQSKRIPELFGKVWYEFINEESWNFIKEFKRPTINFAALYTLMVEEVKRVLPEVF